ncbi:hypothetical protein K1516_12820 [Stenotrophomonas maltophilia]|uniref:hypothetical protein n=1 Tax=Stenotrophomonas maltophilia TaxID=40324 RepID=UPI0020109D97|nr:hypothetical protein [Stenotrophomonas maltophilia]ELF4098708.1 hypothetical protein [Stenotrophomonas maltophilia]UQA68835.1 hypothetical protein K1516_12820 [Stenotrophomonas maltophilia]WQI19320.1 hypothetical protein U2S91_14330 [Stenotrophomonas maltophilia]
MNKSARDALFGMKTLPEQGGGWGLLLKTGPEASDLAPASVRSIQTINDSFLIFAPGPEASGRGFSFVIGIIIGLVGLSMILADFVLGGVLLRSDFWPHLAGAYGILFFISAAFIAWSIRSVVRPLSPPIILSRRLRCFYCWLGTAIGWRALDYDAIQPVTMVTRSYSLAGSATGYVLAIVDLESTDRRIKSYVPLAEPNRDIRAPEMIWEFLRGYMDGDPAKLPEVDPLPPLGDKRADFVVLDRRMYGGFVDDQHRIKAGVFPIIYVGIVGSLMYWFEKAGLWISRVAPRPELPAEVRAEVGVVPSESSCRVRKLTEAERLAYSGRLRHLNRRWLLLASICTVIMLMMFAVPGLPPWFSELNR